MEIRELLIEAGKQLRHDFEELKRSNPHYGERGAEAEEIVRSFLNDHLPKRFAAGSGIVIDEVNEISRQSDVLVYDALNSFVYRKGSRVLILPSDNVAAVFEVKSRLDKAQLKDAAEKIASVKRLKKTPITALDQPVISHPLTMTRTLGVVFAFESSTSLETLAENLAEVNGELNALHWIDLVVVLDKGVIGYAIQMPFSSEFQGDLGGACVEDFPIPPYYVHLYSEDCGELTLNRLFMKLMAHLTIYRKRSALSQDAVIGQKTKQVTTIRAYQYDLEGRLRDTDEYHMVGNFHGPTIRFNLFRKTDNLFLGQIGWIPWQDGAVVSYSGMLPPPVIFQHFGAMSGRGPLVISPGDPQNSIWLSSVLRLGTEEFETIVRRFNGEIEARREDEPGGSLDFIPDVVE